MCRSAETGSCAARVQPRSRPRRHAEPRSAPEARWNDGARAPRAGDTLPPLPPPPRDPTKWGMDLRAVDSPFDALLLQECDGASALSLRRLLLHLLVHQPHQTIKRLHRTGRRAIGTARATACRTCLEVTGGGGHVGLTRGNGGASAREETGWAIRTPRVSAIAESMDKRRRRSPLSSSPGDAL